MNAIANFLCEENKLDFQSALISDTSTDAAAIEQEIVLLQFIQDGVPKTKMASLLNLDHAHAEGVFNLIDSAFNLGSVHMGILKANQMFPEVSQKKTGD